MKHTDKISFVILMITITMFFIANKSISQVTDIDGNTYKTVIIGTQEWMAENLNVEHYSNGDLIPQVQNDSKWETLESGAWCYYENKSSNGKIYGKLYNWGAVDNPRGLAPKGWHIPSDEEWTILTDYLGGITEEKTFSNTGKIWFIEVAASKLKATTLWESSNEVATNESGFTALPGGLRVSIFREYRNIGYVAAFWSSSSPAIYNTDVWDRFLSYKQSYVTRHHTNKYGSDGLSVRCVKD